MHSVLSIGVKHALIYSAVSTAHFPMQKTKNFWNALFSKKKVTRSTRLANDDLGEVANDNSQRKIQIPGLTERARKVAVRSSQMHHENNELHH